MDRYTGLERMSSELGTVWRAEPSLGEFGDNGVIEDELEME